MSSGSCFGSQWAIDGLIVKPWPDMSGFTKSRGKTRLCIEVKSSGVITHTYTGICFVTTKATTFPSLFYAWQTRPLLRIVLILFDCKKKMLT